MSRPTQVHRSRLRRSHSTPPRPPPRLGNGSAVMLLQYTHTHAHAKTNTPFDQQKACMSYRRRRPAPHGPSRQWPPQPSPGGQIRRRGPSAATANGQRWSMRWPDGSQCGGVKNRVVQCWQRTTGWQPTAQSGRPTCSCLSSRRQPAHWRRGYQNAADRPSAVRLETSRPKVEGGLQQCL